MEKETYQINGVEIFSTGKWNGDEYTKEDLQEMVNAFEENKQGARPYIKLGHDKKQKLIQSDGMPAVGWVERVYVQGEKLCADFVDIPKKVYDLIKTKAYRKVSSEIFWNIKIGEKTYKRMLAAVALLGADTPGVMNLNDILSMYNLKDSYEKLGLGNELDIMIYESNLEKKGEKVMEKTERELQLEAELNALKQEKEAKENELKEFKVKTEDSEKEIQELKEYKEQAEADKLKLQLEKEQAENEKFFSDLVNDKLASAAMKEFVIELIGPDKKEYTSGKLTKKDTLKEALKLFAAAKEVSLQEYSSKGQKDQMDYEMEMDKKAKEFMKENKCDYGTAMKAVLKQGKK